VLLKTRLIGLGGVALGPGQVTALFRTHLGAIGEVKSEYLLVGRHFSLCAAEHVSVSEDPGGSKRNPLLICHEDLRVLKNQNYKNTEVNPRHSGLCEARFIVQMDADDNRVEGTPC
jgi:hypothetical protein